MLRLFALEGCPFAQRTRALLMRLNEPFELRLMDPQNKPADFVAASPNGKSPLLVDGELKLYESFILNLYLAEKLGWAQAFSSDAGLRARQRLGMLQFDEVVVPALYKTIGQEAPTGEALDKLTKALAELERTVEKTEGVDNLFGIHCATHWARMRWISDKSPIVPLVEEHVSLPEWLDDAAAMPAIQATLPEKATFLARYAGQLDRK